MCHFAAKFCHDFRALCTAVTESEAFLRPDQTSWVPSKVLAVFFSGCPKVSVSKCCSLPRPACTAMHTANLCSRIPWPCGATCTSRQHSYSTHGLVSCLSDNAAGPNAFSTVALIPDNQTVCTAKVQTAIRQNNIRCKEWLGQHMHSLSIAT